MYYGMRGVTVTDMAKGVEDVQAIVRHANDNLDAELRVAVGLAGTANRLVVLGAYEDLDTLLAFRARVGMDPTTAHRMAAAASNVEPGSGLQYIIRHIHGSTEREQGDFIYFRAVQAKPGRLLEVMPTATAIVDHLSESHGWSMALGAPLGDQGDTLIFATRFRSGNAVDEAFTTLMGDAKYQELALEASEMTQASQDRFLMMLPS